MSQHMLQVHCNCCTADCVDLANSKRKVLCTWWVSNLVVVSNASIMAF